MPDNVKRLSERKRRQWVAIWNSAWERCRDDDGDTDECERRAFAQANGVVLKSNMQFISNAVQMAEARRVNRGGREFLIVPAVMIAKSEQVLNGELVTVDEIAKFPETWNGRPVTLGHPKRAGQHVSAGSPEIHDTEVVGQVWNTTRNGSVRAEIWIDLAKAEALGSDAMLAVQRLEAGEVINVSTGYFRDVEERAGYLDGEPYHGVARNIRPDHLAILLHEQGACSVQDGCGAPRINQGDNMDDFGVNVRGTARRPTFSGTESTAWSAPTLQDYIAAFDGEVEERNVRDMPAAFKRFVARHTLLGDPQADNFRDLGFFPVVNPSSGNLNEGALVAVISGRGVQAQIPAGAKSSAQNMARRLLNSEFDRELETQSERDIIELIKQGIREGVRAYDKNRSRSMTEEERQALIEQIVANA
ncbi:MAG: DUF2213 domain-containing protein, partial [Anaerolineae bacterium]